MLLRDVEGVENEHVLVILRQRDNVALRRDLEPTTTTHFDIRTLKLTDQRAVTLEHCDVEPVAMAVSNQHITSVADVNTVWVVGDVLTADTM